MDRALEILKAAPPDVMNHNLETAPRLYKEARPGLRLRHSLNLLKRFKEFAPDVPTKSGMMVGLGETDDEILQVMRDMRAHDIDMLTIGQYLAPSGHHLPVRRYVHPDTFRMFEREARGDGLHATPPSARWCARATTPTSRRMRRASPPRRAVSAAAATARAAARLRQLPPADAAAGARRPLRPAASTSTSAATATWSGSTTSRRRS